MANIFGWIGVAILVAFVFGPWALLLVEGAGLFFTGHVLTSIPWDQGRVAVALAWPVLWGFIIAGILG